MRDTRLHTAETTKSLDAFLQDLTKAAQEKGFFIHNEDKMEMAHTFGKHGIEVAEGFDLHMIQICKPEKAAPSLGTNPERAALMPKFIITFSQGDTIQIRMLAYGEELIEELIGDRDFAQSVQNSYQAIINIIEEAKASA